MDFHDCNTGCCETCLVFLVRLHPIQRDVVVEQRYRDLFRLFREQTIDSRGIFDGWETDESDSHCNFASCQVNYYFNYYYNFFNFIF